MKEKSRHASRLWADCAVFARLHLIPFSLFLTTAVTALIGAAGTVIVYFFPDMPIPTPTALLALAVIWLGVLPGVRYLLLSPDGRPRFPLFALSGLFYAVFFGFSTFLSPLMPISSGKIDIYGNVLIDNVSVEAQLIIIVGLMLMGGGYALSRAYVWRHPLHFRLPGHADSQRVILLLWGLTAIHFAYVALPELRQLPSIGQFLQPIGFLVFGLFYVLWCRGELSRLQASVVFLILFPLDLLYILRSGFLTNLVLFAILYMFLRLWMRGRLPWIIITALPVLLILAYPILPIFRPEIWQRQSDINVVEAAVIYAKRFFQYYLPGPVPNSASSLQVASGPSRFMQDISLGLTRRLGLIHKLSYVIEKTPSEIPYWGGTTYKLLLTSFIPRVVWPGKPRETTGYAFGVRYQIIHPEEIGHSYNLPWIVEMYANFGHAGIIIGMTLVGVFVAFLERFFSHPNMTPTEAVVGMTVILPLFYQESNFSLMVGGLLPLTVALWLYFAIGLRIPVPAFLRSSRED